MTLELLSKWRSVTSQFIEFCFFISQKLSDFPKLKIEKRVESEKSKTNSKRNENRGFFLQKQL